MDGSLFVVISQVGLEVGNLNRLNRIRFVGIVLVVAVTITSIATLTTYSFYVISSKSMDPTLAYGDMVASRRVDPANIHVSTPGTTDGDIIVYDTQDLWADPLDTPVVHRVVDKYRDRFSGEWYFVCQGDNRATNPGPDPLHVPASKVLGVAVPFWRAFLPAGPFLLVLLLGCIVFGAFFLFRRALTRVKTSGTAPSTKRVAHGYWRQSAKAKQALKAGGLVSGWSIIGNTINGKPLEFHTGQHQAVLGSTPGQIILHNCTRTDLRDYSFVNISEAIHLVCCTGCSIENSTFTNPSGGYAIAPGIALKFSDGCNIIGNRFVNMKFLDLLHSDRNNVEKNTLSGSFPVGISISASSDNTFVDNRICGYTEDCFRESLGSQNNTFAKSQCGCSSEIPITTIFVGVGIAAGGLAGIVAWIHHRRHIR